MQIPAEWEEYVAEQVRSGRFASADEVIADALKQQREDDRKLQALRREVQKGLDDIEAGRIVPAPTLDELFASARARKQAS